MTDGTTVENDDRIKEAMLTENVMLPPLSLYGKDHKPDNDAVKGPKRRPVVSANEGPNARVSDLAADVLNKAADIENSEFECSSTEALQAKVEALNQRLINEAFEEEEGSVELEHGGGADQADQLVGGPQPEDQRFVTEENCRLLQASHLWHHEEHAGN